MARRPHVTSIPLVDRPFLVWPSRVDRDGITGPTPKQARGPQWTKEIHGLYLPADRDPAWAAEQRIVTAAFSAIGAGVVTGWAALRWHGAGWLDSPVVDLVSTDCRVRSNQIMSVTREGIAEEDMVLADGLVVAGPLEAVCFAARHARSVREAVNVLDRAAAADLASLDEVAERLTSDVNRGRRGVVQARKAVALSNENSWSPAETRMRLAWSEMGLRGVLCNTPVFDLDGRHIGTPDLLDLEHGVVGEYDGSDHLLGAQRAKDIRREGAFRRAGLEYVEMVAADLRDPSDFIQRTRDAVGRTSQDTRQGWTVTPPRWWKPTETVQQRRSLSEWDRYRFLGWQRMGRPETSNGPSEVSERAV